MLQKVNITDYHLACDTTILNLHALHLLKVSFQYFTAIPCIVDQWLNRPEADAQISRKRTLKVLLTWHC